MVSMDQLLRCCEVRKLAKVSDYLNKTLINFLERKEGLG